MDGLNEGMCWLDRVLNKLESMFLNQDTLDSMWYEIDSIVEQQQEALKYVGDSVDKFCSGLANEFFPECSGRSRTRACESTLEPNTDESNILSEEDSDEYQLVRRSRNTSRVNHSLTQNPENAHRHHFTVQDIIESQNQLQENPIEEKQVQLETADRVDVDMQDPSVSLLSSTWYDVLANPPYQEKQLGLEISDSVTSDDNCSSDDMLMSHSSEDVHECSSCEKEPLQLYMPDSVTSDTEDTSSPILSSTSNDQLDSRSCTKIIPLGFPSSETISSDDSFEYGLEDLSFDTFDGFVGELDGGIGDILDLGSSQEMNLGESCVIVDRSEFCSVSDEAGIGRPEKEEKLEELPIEEGTGRQEFVDESAVSPHSEAREVEGESDDESSSSVTSDEADWVII